VFEDKSIKFWLTIKYRKQTLSKLFPNSDYQNVTARSIAKIKEQFIQQFICQYGDENPGSTISAEDVEITITPVLDNTNHVDMD
jgi:hypothetical protein